MAAGRPAAGEHPVPWAVAAKPAELVVRRLTAQHHARLERVAAGPEPRRLGRLEADAVADVVPAEFRKAGGAHGGDRRLEHRAALDPGPDRVERRLHARLHGVVRALLALARLANHRHARDVAAIALEDAAQAEAHQLAAAERALARIRRRHRGALAEAEGRRARRG